MMRQKPSSNTLFSFARETNPTLSTLIQDEDPEESETSMDELAVDCMRPPTKHSSSSRIRFIAESARLANPAADDVQMLKRPRKHCCRVLDIR